MTNRYYTTVDQLAGGRVVSLRRDTFTDTIAKGPGTIGTNEERRTKTEDLSALISHIRYDQPKERTEKQSFRSAKYCIFPQAKVVMKALHKATLLLATHLSSYHHAAAVMVGDEVCITGYIMDNCEC